MKQEYLIIRKDAKGRLMAVYGNKARSTQRILTTGLDGAKRREILRALVEGGRRGDSAEAIQRACALVVEGGAEK